MSCSLPRDIQAVFFDFDGVILDNVHVKTAAFARMFQHYGPDVEREVVRYHMEHGGVSRYEKFRHYLENILGEQADDERLAELGRQFAQIVYEQVIKAPFMPGASETLEALHGHVPLYVVSGTPEDELARIVEARRLTGFFEEVHGSPRRKPEIVADVLCRNAWEASRCLFVGDATTDHDAAMSLGMEFLGIVPEGAVSPFPPDTAIASRVAICPAS
ncbi:HAD family hydrolase [Oceanidesulfovibrio indonesiensis]|nr:HAD-IA family hydrolase [Oceanidesulfovibrio indonesiensis]